MITDFETYSDEISDIPTDSNWERVVAKATAHAERFPGFFLDRYLWDMTKQTPGFVYWASRQPVSRVNKSLRNMRSFGRDDD